MDFVDPRYFAKPQHNSLNHTSLSHTTLTHATLTNRTTTDRTTETTVERRLKIGDVGLSVSSIETVDSDVSDVKFRRPKSFLGTKIPNPKKEINKEMKEMNKVVKTGLHKRTNKHFFDPDTTNTTNSLNTPNSVNSPNSVNVNSLNTVNSLSSVNVNSLNTVNTLNSVNGNNVGPGGTVGLVLMDPKSDVLPRVPSFFDLGQVDLHRQYSLKSTESLKRVGSTDSFEYLLFGDSQEYFSILPVNNESSELYDTGIKVNRELKLDRYTLLGFHFNKLLNSLSWLASLQLSSRVFNSDGVRFNGFSRVTGVTRDSRVNGDTRVNGVNNSSSNGNSGKRVEENWNECEDDIGGIDVDFSMDSKYVDLECGGKFRHSPKTFQKSYSSPSFSSFSSFSSPFSSHTFHISTGNSGTFHTSTLNTGVSGNTGGNTGVSGDKLVCSPRFTSVLKNVNSSMNHDSADDFELF